MSIATVDTSSAERRALKIGLRLDTIADNYEAVVPMIREALDLHDHEVLGYASPGAYLADRYGKALSRMPLVVRREFVGELTEAGLSTRAIAAVTGTSDWTVRQDQVSGARDLAPETTVNTETPAPTTPQGEPVSRAVGAGQTTSTEAEANTGSANPAADDVEEAPGEEVEPTPQAPSRPAVTGLDGKTYTPREKPQPKRRPLPDSFFTASYDLGKRIESVHRLTEDDRFPHNAEKVAAAHRNDLLRYRDLLEQVINRLPQA